MGEDESVVSRQLSASSREVASTVERLIDQERRQNEARVALVRLATYSIVFVTDAVLLLAGRREQWLLAPAVILVASVAISWSIQRWYRPWFGYVIPVVDGLFIVHLLDSRLDRLGTGSLGTIATAALACALYAATGAVRFDRRIAAWTTALSAIALWLIIGVRADTASMLYTLAGLVGLAMINMWLAELARRSLEGTLGKELLGRFVQRSVVERAFSNPISLLARPQAIQATVLVSDLRGFTALAERLAPAEVLALLSEVQSALADVVHRNGGTVDQVHGRRDARRLRCARAIGGSRGSRRVGRL